jgi:hypothetical protein
LVASDLTASDCATTGFAACPPFVTGGAAALAGVGAGCLAGAATFFATVAWVAFAAGFAALRCGAARREAPAPRPDPAVPAVAFIPDTSFPSFPV